MECPDRKSLDGRRQICQIVALHNLDIRQSNLAIAVKVECEISLGRGLKEVLPNAVEINVLDTAVAIRIAGKDEELEHEISGRVAAFTINNGRGRDGQFVIAVGQLL